jgi:Uma2 family endonuclease
MVITLKLDPRSTETNPDNGKVVFRYADVLSTPEWPEGPLVELVQGELFMVPSPSVSHQRIVARLHVVFELFLREKHAGEVFIAPVDVILSETDVVVPDVCFVSSEKKGIVNKENIKGTPDLVVEVLSTNKNQDKVVKKALYERYKVKEYWIVDPDAGTIQVFVFDGKSGTFSTGQVFSQGTTLKSTTIPGFSIQLDAIFKA